MTLLNNPARLAAYTQLITSAANSLSCSYTRAAETLAARVTGSPAADYYKQAAALLEQRAQQ